MIKRFKFQNLFSFENETIIDFTKKKKIKDSDEYVVKDEYNEFLKFLVVYGKNNVGKSNLINAIMNFSNTINNSALHLGINSLKENYKKTAFFWSTNEPVKYEIIFTNKTSFENLEFRYGFSFNEKEILTEYLYKRVNNEKETVVFKKSPKNKNDIEAIINSKVFTSSPGLFVNIPKDKLLLPIAANVGEFNSRLAFGSISGKHIYIGQDANTNIFNIPFTTLNNDQIEHITQKIKDMDVGIDKVIIKNQDVHNFFTGGSIKSKIPYYILKDKEIPLNFSSNGTKKIINYLSIILNLINKMKKESNLMDPIFEYNFENIIFFIDEFENGLHPLIIEKLINDIFKSISDEGFEKNIQIIMTTHNPFYLDNANLRRDQILMIEKNEDTLSSYIEELGEKGYRKDLSRSKALMEGKLGGTPFMINEDEINKIVNEKIKIALKSNKNFNELMEKLADS